MFGSTGILIALIVVTIVLASVFLVRSSITAGATGKILAFVGLCALPALCVGTGMSFQSQRSKQTRFCITCHAMQGKSLHLLNPNYIPAHHFQDHLVPPDMACYTCHTDYALYGPFRDKLRGLWNISIQYLSTPPKTMRIPGGYNNAECLQCHAGTRNFEDHLASMPPLASLESNHVSCISCHDLIHNVSQVDHMKMWSGGAVLTGTSSPASATAKPSAAGGAAKAAAGSSAGAATATGGKAIFDSQHCSACHGESGGGGKGPALTQITRKFSPARLTALLKAPTAAMKAGGMVALTLNDAEMQALVAYLASLGGAAATAPESPVSGLPSASSAQAKAGARPPAGTGGSAIFSQFGCDGCHGAGGVGGTAAAPGLAGIGERLSPAALVALLRHPSVRMRQGGMPQFSLSGAELQKLVAYLSSIPATKGTSQ